MNWLDGAIIVLILWFTYSAFQAGFIRETVTVVATILGIVLAGLFYESLAEDVLLFIDNPTFARIVGFGLIFGAIVLAGQMVARVLKPTVNFLQLGIFDQLAGAGFGLVKSLVFTTPRERSSGLIWGTAAAPQLPDHESSPRAAP